MISKDDLRKLFLFESLDDEKLAWVQEHSTVVEYEATTRVYSEGEPATCFVVLLEGAVTLTRNVHGQEIEVSRTDQLGVYGGAIQAYLGDQVDQKYPNSMVAITPVKALELPADQFGPILRRWFPMAMHLMEGLFWGQKRTQSAVSERERLIALGSLSAGLTHELNNPASAAVRATATLRDKVAGMRHKLAMIAEGKINVKQLHRLVELQEAAVKRAANAPKLSALETGDAEDAVVDWLQERGLSAGFEYDHAATLVAGDASVPWLDLVAEVVDPSDLQSAVSWLTYTIETELLMGEIDESVGRISALVGAAKQYSQLDRAPHQVVDLHKLLDSTLVMMTAKISPNLTVVKEYDHTLPEIPCYPAELNQVWTNLIDNALGAMGDRGTLTIRTERDGDQVAVTVGDTGTGIDPEIRPRIFEPFFTTKPVGEGTGLGLDISYRIVVNKHNGDIRVQSEPGRTEFTVLLPVEETP
ncbi:ATP-binding protein [Phytohabitans sp. ZYX-F-186]|uniref:histidine kinase n=1 Tax=Phytohabitans maris TaxID=3071409 RepID=A0ABU0ZPF1_9ACTN|nr:ATP-binding protein [Phytohabitans sp. ZYX-F-186]MDQ7907807.1 ATP-binding protein [Phytohabitans sp. ZYX-F-186]